MDNNWLAYEETFVRMNYKKLTTEVISRALVKSEEEVYNKAIELGLDTPKVVEPVLVTVPEITEQITLDLSQVTKSSRADRIKNNGGWYIYMPEHPKANCDGYIFEHRLIMEKQLGRYLKDDERVYKKDGDRFNNSPDNLILRTDKKIDNYKNEIIQKINEGRSITSIVKEYDCSFGAMYKLLRTIGYNVGEGFTTTKYIGKQEKLNKLFILLYNKGYNREAIMRMLKVSEKLYYKTLHQNQEKLIIQKDTNREDELTLFMLLRIQRKTELPMFTIQKYYKINSKLKSKLNEKARKRLLELRTKTR